MQGDGSESRDFIHIQDISRGLEVLLQKAAMQGEVYNMGCGEETRIADLAAILMDSLSVKLKVVFSGESPAGVPKNWKADIGLVRSFGFVPQVSLKEGARIWLIPAGWLGDSICSICYMH